MYQYYDSVVYLFSVSSVCAYLCIYEYIILKAGNGNGLSSRRRRRRRFRGLENASRRIPLKWNEWVIDKVYPRNIRVRVCENLRRINGLGGAKISNLLLCIGI